MVGHKRVEKEISPKTFVRKCWKAMGLDDEYLKELENIFLENLRKGAVIEG